VSLEELKAAEKAMATSRASHRGVSSHEYKRENKNVNGLAFKLEADFD